ncbi:long-chain-fatty-acid--CoA ligase [Neobacillus niacini]|uniref:long-chain-fatty-acid--CoA ligase n=1 Tax=Neobacillus niacini TaxID=86668 RepID=UPI0021CB42FF|nr:long-chain-fatty-acid--CoA ligase [Neobacillus niacini]MCM3766110.1 long-chain-fatty-acid--CoA ligase [Neobacillus niacini]
MDSSILTVNDLLNSLFFNHANRIAVHFPSRSFTYRELHKHANRVAHGLIKRGVKNNTRVALLLSNTPEYLVSELAIFFAGGTKVPLNNMLRESDILYILNDSDAEVLIVEEQFFPIIKNIQMELPKLKTIIGVGSEGKLPDQFISWETFQATEPESLIEVQTKPTDLSLILYTGGTTGKPKGVVHTHQGTVLTFLSIVLETNMKEDEKILLTTPLPHAAGLYLYAGLVKGAQIYIESKFDPENVLKHIEQNKITFLSAVPTTLYRLFDFMEGKEFDVTSIRTIQYGTAPITATRLRQGLEIFGQVFLQIYGLTETQSAATWLKKYDHRLDGDNLKVLQSCGKSTIMSRIKIVDESGNQVGPGVEGEIAVKALTNMVGYHKLSDKTSETIRDGWLHTGDVGVMDEKGYLYLLDRKKDMIISGGMNVYSSEVENVIQKHPDVRQVAVIGIPDQDWGEAVTAFIIPKNNQLNVEGIMKYCKNNLSKYKVPKSINIVEELPLTNYGKIDKKALRTPYWEMVDRKI